MENNYISRNYGRSEIMVPITDNSNKTVPDKYNKFILSNVSESWGDQVSFYKSYDQWWVKSLGNKPSIRHITGFVPDEYESGFQLKYLNLWRLSVCLKNDRKVHIIYKNRTTTGYIVNLIISHQKKSLPQFSFDFIVVGKDMLFSLAQDVDLELLEFNRNLDMDDSTMKAGIYKHASMGEVYDSYKEFILTSISKQFLEKYRTSDIGDRDFNIMSFGSMPPQYRCTILVSDYIDDDDSSWEVRFLTNLRDEWLLGKLSDGEILNLTYKNHVVSGYIINVGGTSTTSRGMALTFDFMPTAEDGIRL